MTYGELCGKISRHCHDLESSKKARMDEWIEFWQRTMRVIGKYPDMMDDKCDGTAYLERMAIEREWLGLEPLPGENVGQVGVQHGPDKAGLVPTEEETC